MNDEELEIKDFLEHHGVKGQRWGVRHAPQRLSKFDEQNVGRLSRAKRVAKGTGSVGDKASVLARQSTISLIRGGGLQGAAANDVSQLEARRKRIKQGKATVLDILAIHGGSTLFNV